MHRTAVTRQAESARNYADFSSVDSSLDTLLTVTAGALGYSIAMVNILDDSTQYTLARHGAPADTPYVHSRETATCRFVVDSSRALAIEDSTVAQFCADSAVSGVAENLIGHQMRSYLGVPLFGREGVIVGTLCVLDHSPHDHTADAQHTLVEFGHMVEHYLEALRSRGRNGGTATAKIADALRLGEITPWFQPVVDMETGRVVALEALARWHRPDTGLLGPDAFLPAIGGSDLEIDVDHSILQSALHSFAAWSRADPDLDLHVNLSARHLGASHGVEHLDEIVAQSGVPAARVVFELTETQSLVDRMQAGVFVSSLRERGFRVLLDDIGIGYSSLERLLDIPVDGFKIDSAIARTLGTTSGDSLIKALVGFAADTSCSLVIEGLETEAQVESARRNGCVAAQGWHFSRALPAEHVACFLGR